MMNINYLWKKSGRFLENAEENFSKNYPDIAMFSLYQSLELFLKGLLISKSGDFPHTHNIGSLLELLKEFVDNMGIDLINRYLEDYSLEISMITDAYTASRYFESSYTLNSVNKIIDTVKKIEGDLSV